LLWAGIVLHAMLPLAIIRVLICSVRAARVFMSHTVSDLVSSVLGVSAVNHTFYAKISPIATHWPRLRNFNKFSRPRKLHRVFTAARGFL